MVLAYSLRQKMHVKCTFGIVANGAASKKRDSAGAPNVMQIQ